MAKKTLEKPKHISYSQIRTGKCRLRYLHLVLMKDIKRDNKPLRLGRLVHQIIAEYSRECIKQKLEADYEIMDEIIKKRFDESGLEEEYFIQIRESCIRFGERGFNYNTLLLYEEPFTLKVGMDDKGKDIIVKGIVDRVNVYDTPDGPSVDIIDYKNQKNIMTEEAVRTNEQLNLYAYWFFMHKYRNGFFIGRTGIYHVPYSFTRWSGDPRHVSEWMIDFQNVEEWIIRQWNRLINAKTYPPERGPWCWEYGGCPVMLEGQCPRWSEEEVESMRTGTLIKDKVRSLRKVDFDRKIQFDQVKELFKGGDTSEVDNQEVGFVPSISYKYDLAGFLKWLQKYEVEPEGLALNKTDVEGIVKRLKRGKIGNGEMVTEEDEAKLEALKQETASSRFVF